MRFVLCSFISDCTAVTSCRFPHIKFRSIKWYGHIRRRNTRAVWMKVGCQLSVTWHSTKWRTVFL